MAKPPKSPKFTRDGRLSERGHGEGSIVTRFASGDGRPRPGKPKGTRDEKALVLAIRDMPTRIVVERDEDGRPIRRKSIPTQEAILLKQRDLALKGDHKAVEHLDRKFTQFAPPPPVELELTAKKLEEDQQILARALERKGSAPAALPPPEPITPDTGNESDE